MFAKIFASIFDSSIAEDWQTRVVFQDMLVLADKDGIVDMTPTSIARRTNIPLEMVQAAIPKLEAPDPSSRTETNEGRRIVRRDAHRDWGWQIVNFTKYRESASKEMLRMAEADRKKAYRAKFGKSPSPTPPTPTEIQKQREKQNSPGLVPDKSGTNAPQDIPAIERIILDREIQRITNRLDEIKDANLESFVREKRELAEQLDAHRAKLGLPPISNKPAPRRGSSNPRVIGQSDDRNTGTANAGRSAAYAKGAERV